MPDKLQAIVEESGVNLSTEGYTLNWLGKSYARLLANENLRTLLQADTTHNNKPENTNSQNLLIKGDNLEVLKHLKGAYSRQVKMIYIDPPYNTGSDGFVYADDRKFTAEQLSHLAGIGDDEAQRILDFTHSKSNSHSAWLTFMYPRLYIARALLRDDGVIFISIDDNEQANLELLCNEVFGEENVEKMIWNKEAEGSSGTLKQILRFRNVHETIIVCYKNKDIQKFSRISEPLLGKEGELQTANLAVNEDSVKTGHQNWKELISPTGKKWFKHWKFNNEELNRLIEDDLIYWGKDGGNQPRLIIPTDHRRKVYAQSIINKGGTTQGRKDFESIMGEGVFSYPKPLSLISFLMQISNANDLILDFFAGSGTTAHAVMQLNADDGGNRQFITVQLPEITDIKSEAYHTIFDITRERITRAAAKIKSENPEYKGDLGFKIFETIPVFDGYLDEPEELSANLELFNGDTLTEQDRLNLLLTWSVQDEIPLTQVLTPVDLAGYIAYQGGDAGRLLYFIHPHLSLDVVIELLRRLDDDPTFAPKHLIVWGYGLDSKEQREMSEAIAHHNKSNRKSIELDLEVRF